MAIRSLTTALMSTLVSFAIFTGGSAAPIPVVHSPNIRTHGGGPLSTSSNWSGYAVPTGNNQVTDVKGNWTVPSVSCNSGNQWSSIWVGIDGYNSSTVEQTGTEQDCQGNQAVYSAWYEMYPKFPVTLNMTIRPGDRIFAEVHYNGSKYVLTLTNQTTGATFTTSQKGHGNRSSAEWIVEAPSSSGGVLPLANFGTAYLTNSTATINGVTGTISAFSGYDAITMASNGVTKAVPSGLSNGGADFSVAWRHQ